MTSDRPTVPGDTGRNSGQGNVTFHLYPVDAEEKRVSLFDLWTLVRVNWLLIAVVTALFVVTAVAFALTRQPVYRGQILISPVSEDKRGSSLTALAGQFGGASALAGLGLDRGEPAVYIATLRSRALAEQFIVENNLMPILFAEESFGGDSASGSVGPEDAPTLWDAVDKLEGLRELSEDAQTGIVTLTVDWTDPHLAASWANGLVKLANDVLRKRKIEESKRSLAFLDNELSNIEQVELRAAVFRLMEAEMKNVMFANVRPEFAFKVIDPAVPPENKHSPNGLLLTLLGFAFGLSISLLIVFVRHAVFGNRAR